MKKFLLPIFALLALGGATSCNMTGQNNGLLSNVLGGDSSTGTLISGSGNSTTGSGLGNLGSFLEGVLSTSNITVADMAGQWTVDGSAVAFRSENFLKKAGGAAAATAIENKLNPIYQQYGLTGAVITIQTDGTFTLQSNRISLSGNIAQEKNGNFKFTFTALGGIKIASMDTYVQKGLNSLDIMFDASKLQTILDIAAQLSGSKLAGTASDLLNSYDGICVGFATTKTGNVQGQEENGLGNILNGIFGGGK